MKKYIFLLLIIHCSLLIAQLPIQEWVARIPGPNNDLIGPFFAVDKQGNSYVAGTRVINDTINILCAKYSTLGAQQWMTFYKYPGDGYFAPAGLALDSSGNAYVISIYAQNLSSPRNSLLVKFNSLNGSPVWAKKYVGQYGTSAFNDIKIDRLENIYAVGWSDTSHLVIRYNTNGDSVWVRKYHSPFARETARACTIDDSLNIIFTGHRIHSFDTLLVAKYSSGGVLRWESTYAQGVNENVGTKITADLNGSLYIGGVTVVSGAVVYLTLKYDRNGAWQWTAIYDAPGSGNNTLQAIALDRVNNALFVTGTAPVNNLRGATTIKYNASTGDSIWVRRDTGTYEYGSAGDIKLDSAGNSYLTGGTGTFNVSQVDVLTIKYSVAGSPIWLITYNGSYNGGDAGYKIELDSQNNIFVLGVSQSSSQIFDYVVIKYAQLVGIEPISNEVPNVYKLLQNYPNPFNQSTVISYQIPINSEVVIKLYDILGREVKVLVNAKQRAGIYAITMNAGLSSGVYLYQLIANSNIVGVKKLIIVR